MKLVFALFISVLMISCGDKGPEIKEVKIGNQTWSLNNLDVTAFTNGDPIKQAQSQAEWDKANEAKEAAWCYYDGNAEFGKKNGKLYNFYAVSDARGIAPKGWHIPSKDDWTLLFNSVGGTETAGEAMKNTQGWIENGNGTNTSGFSAMPSGYRDLTSKFQLAGYAGGWWSSTPVDENNALGVHNAANIKCVTMIAVSKNNGGSIRIVKD